jgi:hypothetical protein
MKLPEPVTVAIVFATGEEIPGYTAEQMLAWGKATAEAEREACARLVVGLFDPEDVVAEAIAEAILARGNT